MLLFYSNDLEWVIQCSKRKLNKTLNLVILLNVEFEMELHLEKIKNWIVSPPFSYTLLNSAVTQGDRKNIIVSKEKRLISIWISDVHSYLACMVSLLEKMKITRDLGCSELRTPRSPTSSFNSAAGFTQQSMGQQAVGLCCSRLCALHFAFSSNDKGMYSVS